MSDKRPKKDGVEVSSQSLQEELVAIKDRLSAIETIASISNATAVRKYVEDHLKTDKQKAIMKECAEPRPKSYLISKFAFNSPQALDHHMKPLLKDNLLRLRVDEDRTVVFEWSELFRSLPNSAITAVLKAGK